MQVGGAKVSDKHANFILNTGQATAKDIKKLSDQIIQIIKDKYGVTLEREVFFIGV
jgi:UDP-N-acetylmuramate dehydrogenase